MHVQEVKTTKIIIKVLHLKKKKMFRLALYGHHILKAFRS